ncbi:MULTISPECIES: M3 family oligoendopeptidase [Bacillus cereus group]|uniref:M3 family oligoendopeptidase n=1 Tax=Bacillus cereus group TaxID=86661 RepID=UPI0022DEB4A4|nr:MULTISPECIES: M3 family oligoendopeptidase [unclassified Bacillus cereus group]MDA2663650.1 M3 family oligoendopeptidase [Bacillus cereus group sp. Bc032]MDA2674378.1 M3 family oligoendopeptidase [Bacillus cereus group sp. Bc031]MDA2679719.1 M3 family oligoendopeptidase [Bacillus cereus group sp. Bc029]MDA2685316.1 M3 family oligoendopeptidase [Bacillus cereus group sp. Bc030]MDA2740703.1 M3 family oligoendopeptidase [Bacillus cereus group sp. Bc011]
MQRVNTIDISNVLQLEKTLSSLLNKMISSKLDLESWLKEQSKVIWEIEEQLRAHYIAFQCNTDDEKIKDTFEHDQQFVKPLLKRYQNLLDNKYLESPFRIELDSNVYGLLDAKIKNAQKLFCEENIELEVKEDKLVTEYFEITGGLIGIWDGEEKTITELQSYLQDSNRDIRKKAKTIISEQFLSVEKELQNILNQLIEIRHQKAKNIQLENYRDYMFKKYERFDYSAKDCYELAESIRKYVVPLKDKILLEKKEKLQVDTLRPWDVSAVTPDQKVLKPIANENDLIEKSTHIFNKLDLEFSTLLNRMYKHDCLDLTSRKGKASGGFCEYLPASQLAFIFMNLNYTQNDIITFIHEMGHSIHNELIKPLKLRQYIEIPAETAELASMTMELFSLNYWDTFYTDKKDLKQAKINFFKDVISYLPIMLIVDQFQHWLYENPSHTSEERNEKYLQLQKHYQSSVIHIDGYENWIATSWLPVLHIFEVPFYYIEYAIAQLGALQMYKQYKEDPKQALENYKKALSLGSSKSLTEVYEAAGIRFDFSSETIKELMAFVEKELELLEQL